MIHRSHFRLVAVALLALAGASLPQVARADVCAISFSVLKAGWFIGGSGGNGTLQCGRRVYPISIGGISAGLVFGASETRFHGSAIFYGSPYNVAGVYGAAGAGGAVGVGAQAIVLKNEKGTLLRLTGRQVGLQVNVDLSGLSIAMR